MSWFTQRFEREEKPAAAAIPARRRRMLLWSMILVIPLGVLSVGTGINVVIAAGVQQTYSSGDYQAAAAWARAGVSLNPFDRYLPHYNLGTAYAAGDLLPEAVPELQTALDNAPSPEAACYPRANLALTYVRLGNRYYDDRRWLDAIAAYRAAKASGRSSPTTSAGRTPRSTRPRRRARRKPTRTSSRRRSSSNRTRRIRTRRRRPIRTPHPRRTRRPPPRRTRPHRRRPTRPPRRRRARRPARRGSRSRARRPARRGSRSRARRPVRPETLNRSRHRGRAGSRSPAIRGTSSPASPSAKGSTS